MEKKLLIAQPIEKELQEFNNLYRSSINSDNPKIQSIIEQVLKSDGKKIRPVLLLLAAKACGEINETTYNSAVTVELLHTASLIHDDVVDESKIRRGQPSLNAIYDNQMAVLVGDYFLSTALIKSVFTGSIKIIAIISNLGRSLAEGELNQLYLAKNAILSEEDYFEVIKKKTASLLSVCMKVGAISVNASQEDTDKFEQLGEYLGICFQLRDDIFDYFKNDIGKPTGNDIKEGKVTLPLLYALKNTADTQKDALLSIISNNEFTEENIERLISFARENGGIEYATQKMNRFKEKALDIIDSFPESDTRRALYSAVDYVVERRY